MAEKKTLFILIMTLILVAGCVKESYDMSKMSGDIYLSPTLVLPGAKGNVEFSDLVKSSDTVVFDQDNFVRIIYRQDSVINFGLSDLYDFDNMVSFHKAYELGVLSLGSFQGTLSVTLNQITQNLSTALRNQIAALDDGSTHLFPPFPSVNLGERTFSIFPNFESAVLESGYLDISVKNNLTAPVSGLNINLFNSVGHTSVGSLVIPQVLPGQTQTTSVDLSGKTLANSLIAAIVLAGSPGTSTPVIISLNNSGITLTASGRDLKIRSGKVIIPTQAISTLDNKDTIAFDPGFGIELDKIVLSSGNLSYEIQTGASLAASFSMTLPTVLRNNNPVTHTITTGTSSILSGTINFDGTIIDMASDPAQPYNKIPMVYSIQVGSDNVMVNFNSADEITVDFSLVKPYFDYVKGYFGQVEEIIDPDTLDLGVDDLLNHLEGSFLISSPSIKLNYSNSFAIPLKIDFQASGIRGSETVSLGLDPISVAYPKFPESRNAASSIVIDKNNSDLPELISLPPGQVVFSGSAKVNPEGNTGSRDNYIFGESRFLASAEVEVPMELRFTNLQFTDTIDNFLQVDAGSDSPIKPENFQSFEFLLTAKNYFPLGVTTKMSLYDDKTNTIKSTIDATTILEAAPVDANGKSNGFKETTTKLLITKSFFDNVSSADKIIIWFTLNTTANGSVDVKIYSDNRIEFKTAVVVKPEIIL